MKEAIAFFGRNASSVSGMTDTLRSFNAAMAYIICYGMNGAEAIEGQKQLSASFPVDGVHSVSATMR